MDTSGQFHLIYAHKFCEKITGIVPLRPILYLFSKCYYS